MANNRMYLRCPVCPDEKPLMIAKFYPSTGWYAWFPMPCDEKPGQILTSAMDEFFEKHRHVSQWGSGFIIEYEIRPDFPMENPPDFAVSKTEPFPLR